MFLHDPKSCLWPSWQSIHVGQWEKFLREVFSEAYSQSLLGKLAVIFIDEFDAICPRCSNRQLLHTCFLCACKWGLNVLIGERMSPTLLATSCSDEWKQEIVKDASSYSCCIDQQVWACHILISKYHCCYNSRTIPWLRILLGHGLQSIHNTTECHYVELIAIFYSVFFKKKLSILVLDIVFLVELKYSLLPH